MNVYYSGHIGFAINDQISLVFVPNSCLGFLLNLYT